MRTNREVVGGVREVGERVAVARGSPGPGASPGGALNKDHLLRTGRADTVDTSLHL